MLLIIICFVLNRKHTSEDPSYLVLYIIYFRILKIRKHKGNGTIFEIYTLIFLFPFSITHYTKESLNCYW